ncbi:hypothetical protein AOQ84DRAFT_372941 [Glonium stellatum]|uniref:Uncharacterized protein n=1 Tax=Glonium stellatum TaxID=574774 RepID=A0A8E2F8V9_9PEZI|nr:hypothetical protein AOQ84DRAFT_372941 [Glonium stellatum]
MTSHSVKVTLAWLYMLGILRLAVAFLQVSENRSTLSKISSRQQLADDPIRRFLHGSIVTGKTLYIDGGEETVWLNGAPTKLIHNGTLAIDLSVSFHTLRNTSATDEIKTIVIDKGGCPNFNVPQFWVEKTVHTAYAYGGEYSYSNPWVGGATVPLEAFWAFTPSTSGGGTWTQLTESSDTVWNSLTRPAYGLSAYGDIGGFNLGGLSDSRTSQKSNIQGYIPVPGLQFSNFTSKAWSNSSALGYSADGTALNGGMVYVPSWGSSGLLVALGGSISPSLTVLPDEGLMGSMINISLYDPSTLTWYHQVSTGIPPDQRDRFCLVGAQGGDNSTYEIFLYSGQAGLGPFGGGQAQMDANALRDDVYILSLPAFTWFKVNYSPSDPRIYHTCHVVGNRQLISVGGLNPSAPSPAAAMNDTDPFILGLKVFDMTELQWTNFYNASAEPYVPPDVIAKYYTANGRYPTMWNDPRLKDIFIPPINTTSNTTFNTTTPNTTTHSTEKHSHTGVIVGGTLGGVAGTCLLGILAYIALRKSSKRGRITQRAETVQVPHEIGGRSVQELSPEGRLPEIEDSAPKPEPSKPKEPVFHELSAEENTLP